MYELIQLSDRDFFVDCPAKMGIVRLDDRRIAAIDSGSDKDAGKKLLRAVEANGWELSAVYLTHSHADHIGGNRLLQDRTGCRIYARGVEQAMSAFPMLEPACLYGGYPVRELQNKFFVAQESRVEPLTEAALPEGWSLVPLPGHTADQVGFRTAEDTVYLGDCLASAETLRKYGLVYLWDVGAYLATLEQVKTMEARWFVPAHAPASEQIAELAQENIRATLDAAERIENLCREPVTFEELLAKTFREYGLAMSIQQYALLGSTLRSYLSWLREQGRVNYSISEEHMFWQTCL